MLNSSQVRYAASRRSTLGDVAGPHLDPNGNLVDSADVVIATADEMVGLPKGDPAPSLSDLMSAVGAAQANKQLASPSVFLQEYGQYLLIGAVALVAFGGGFVGGRR